MSTESTILVPIDFSPGSEAALWWAARFAASTRAQLHVLHVVHDPGRPPEWFDPEENFSDEMQTLERQGEEIFAQFMERMIEAGVPGLESALRTVLVGLPASRILEFAKRVGTDHIVMGSHGRTGLEKLLLGSKAERVVRLSSVPVTVVKAQVDEGS